MMNHNNYYKSEFAIANSLFVFNRKRGTPLTHESFFERLECLRQWACPLTKQSDHPFYIQLYKVAVYNKMKLPTPAANYFQTMAYS